MLKQATSSVNIRNMVFTFIDSYCLYITALEK